MTLNNLKIIKKQKKLLSKKTIKKYMILKTGKW